MFVNELSASDGAWEDDVMSDAGVVQVYASADATDGHLIRGRLESEGIPVMVKGEGEGPYRMGPIYLWVPSERETAARVIIDAVRSGAFELDEGADVAATEAANPTDA
jgi:Putative prokaryotic signal transducing protein